MLNPFETLILLDEESETSFDDSKEVADFSSRSMLNRLMYPASMKMW